MNAFISMLKEVGLGLSELLRYAFGGLLLLFLASLLDHDEAKRVVDVTGPGLAGITALAIGVAIYVCHRSLIIPLHHVSLCCLFRLWEFKRTAKDQTKSPTRFLGEVIGVPFGCRIMAYTVLRRAKLTFLTTTRETMGVIDASGLTRQTVWNPRVAHSRE